MMTDQAAARTADDSDLARRLRPYPGDGEPTTFQAEIIEGRITITNPPCPARAAIIEGIRRTVAAGLAPGEGCFGHITLEEPRGDRYIPNLAVWPTDLVEGRGDRTFPGERCAFAIEVTPRRRTTRASKKSAGYARAGVPLYLVVDRAQRECIIHANPVSGRYTAVSTEPFGNPITVPLDPAVTLDTTEW
jgi:Putative restriction endonuclease